jgi:hypothetical protein
MAPTLTGFVINRLFLRSYSTDSAHRNNPRNLDELETDISNTITDISPTTLRAVSTNMLHRAGLCIEHAGWCTLPKLLVARCTLLQTPYVKKSRRLKESPCCAYDFRQNGPSLLIQALLTFLTWVLVKKNHPV